MGKKVVAVAVTALIVVIWAATLYGVGPIGPISKDIKLGLDIKGGVYVVMEAQTDESDPQALERLMQQTQSVIENRVNEMGLSEPIVTIEGDNRIRVELPGAEDADEAIETIGKTAQLRFLLADGSDALSGADIEDSGVDRAQNSARYVVTLEFSAAGQQKFLEATTTAYNRTLPAESVMQPITDAEPSGSAIETTPDAIAETATPAAAETTSDTAAEAPADDASAETATDAATETTSDAAAETSPDAIAATDDSNVLRYRDQAGNILTNPNGFAINNDQIIIVLDNEIISAPSVNSGPIDSRSAIIEEFTMQEATDLSMLIRGGALPVELKDVESSAIGASIGMGALEDSVKGGIIGIILVLVFMFVMYRIFGLAANLALLLYIPLVLWWLVVSKAVLTLPGIAGIVLSIGMAVDANVIIISRIREEVGNGKTIRVAQRDGMKKALSAVLDSQITTIIAALVLYQLGTGPVRGFAFTLASGIVIGLVTAIFVANIYTQNFIESPLLKKPFLLGIKEGEADSHTRFHFNYIKHRKKFYIATLVILVVGIGMGFYHGHNNGNVFGNIGIDFSGGTRLQIDMEKAVPDSSINETLVANGIDDAEIVRYTPQGGDSDDGVIIKTTKSLNADERQEFLDNFLSEYGLTDENVDFFEQFGPSIGRMLTDKAIQAVLWASLFMLIYISFRFKWRYGVASIIAVFHDVAILFAMYGLFNITINNPFIAAVLTVVGYSINDTIVIFDRIRENFGLLSGRVPLTELLDTSINQTLVRSLMTGMSTILAIIPLIIFGGDTIREFVVPLLIGIVAGACSSIFIASPIYYELTKIGGGGEGVAGYRRSRSKYEESVAKAKAGKKARKQAEENELPAPDAKQKPSDATGSGKNGGKGGGDKPTGGGGGGKGQGKKSRKKRKSSRTGGAVV
ncbi:MAG: protein translocase subunit SecD [Clostridiales Family XIII bacterium]|jgi:SecD/SecF fusion protein|nr:protein translocase subunit SecD [Clostridiales Family XIII bacterium]